MFVHEEKRDSPYTPKQLYDMVADIETYPEFLPWCSGARIVKRVSDTEVLAELIINFKVFQERYTSKVTFEPPASEHEEGVIRTELVKGPFKHLHNFWKFIPKEDGGAVIDVYIDFQFKTKVLEKLIGLMYEVAVKTMARAFEERAKTLYST